MDERNQDNKHQNHDPEWEALKDALNSEVPQLIENKLNKRFEAFREDLKAHPYVAEENRPGASKWSRISTRSPSRFRSFALAGTTLICMVLGVYLFVGNSTPTWAEVNQSFASYPFHAATIYHRSYAFSETVSMEYWVGPNHRIRLREGNRVTFAKKGADAKTFDLDTREESYLGVSTLTLEILKRRGFLKQYNPHPSTPRIEATFSGRIDETSAIRVDDGSRISKDIVVFEAQDDGKWGHVKIRFWVLRSSKLPIRVSRYGPGGMRTDVVYSYFKEPPEAFFDPIAFEAKLKDTDNSTFDLLYMGLEDSLEK